MTVAAWLFTAGGVQLAGIGAFFLFVRPAREAIFSELARVVRPGGRVFAAELILNGPLLPEQRRSESDWFS